MSFALRRLRLLVFLGAGSLGCGGRTLPDEQGVGGAPGPVPTDTHGANACARACREAHPLGAQIFFATGSECVCEDCDASCSKRVCGKQKLPSDACLECVQTSIAGEQCVEHAGLFTACRQPVGECGDFTQCLLACDP